MAMPWNRPRQSPARHRSRSRTPGGRGRHRAPTETFRAGTQDDEEIQPLSPDNHRLADEAVTVFPNNSGPRMLSHTTTEKDGNSGTKQGLLSRLSGTIYESVFQKEQSRIDQLEQKNEKMREKNKKLLEENGSLNRDVGGLMRSLELKSVECNGLRARLAQLGQNNASPGLRSGSGDNQKLDYGPTAKLQQKIAEYEDRVRKLETQNAQLLQKTSAQQNHIQAQTAKFARELEDIRGSELIRAPKVSDSEIQGKWKALNFAVRQFVAKYLPESLDFPTVQGIAQQEEFKWLPEISKTLRYPILCHVVLESWVWHFLCFRILDSQSEFWAGDIGIGFNTLKDRVGHHINNHEHQSTSRVAAVSRFHDWRVRSSHFISQLEAHDKNSSLRIAGDMLASLRHTLPSISPQDRVNQNMYQDILVIIQKAAELDNIFRMSKAHFHVFITRVKQPLVHPPGFGFEFDSQTMEYFKDMPNFGPENDNPIVDLAVSPGIFKAGNSAGANFTSERVLVKLQALCGLQNTLAILDEADVKEEERRGGEQLAFIKQEREEDLDVDMLCPGAWVGPGPSN